MTHAEVREWYQRPLSFTRYLPWVDYLEEDRCVLLEDGQSVGAFFELIPVGCEARPQAYLESLHAAVTKCLLHAIPEDDPPWVVQCFVQVEPVTGDLMRTLRAYVAPGAERAPYPQHFLDELARHLARLELPAGYFFDDHTGYPWRVKA
ncbi:MAG: TraC family protein, partial [Gammaproteobacteria bacterium]